MNKGQLLLVSAPSGAGKTSLVQAALEKDDSLRVSVSHTTRAKRPSEKEGVNYHFIDDKTFNDMIEAGDFLEYAHVFDHYYGTARTGVNDLLAQGHNVILEIDWQGAAQVKTTAPEAVGIFILPPSPAMLAQRLTNRGQDSAEVIQRRLSEAKLEMSKAPEYNYIIINDDFEHALTDFLAIMRSIKLRTNLQIQSNPAVKAILSLS